MQVVPSRLCPWQCYVLRHGSNVEAVCFQLLQRMIMSTVCATA